MNFLGEKAFPVDGVFGDVMVCKSPEEPRNGTDEGM
jgi:hypothetical protein